MSGSGRLQSDPLFQGLTRTTMIAGVDYMFFVVNAIVCLITFVNLQSFVVLLGIAPTIHLIGYVICLKEPRTMQMAFVKVRKGLKCMNRRFHGYTNSYDLY